MIRISKLDTAYPYSCLMVDFPEELAKKVIAWGNENIKDDNLYTEEEGRGREDHIHTTVCYGIKPEVEFETIKEKCDLKPIKVSLGKIAKFDTNEHYDVIKIDVKGEGLHKLHKQIEEEIGCPGNTYPEYKPHLTVAYVKKGSCDDLIGQDPFEGEEFELSRYDYSQAGEDNKHIKHQAHYVTAGIKDFLAKLMIKYYENRADKSKSKVISDMANYSDEEIKNSISYLKNAIEDAMDKYEPSDVLNKRIDDVKDLISKFEKELDKRGLKYVTMERDNDILPYLVPKKSHYIPDNSSPVPNPLRKNYDYSGEMGGPEWQNRVKTYMKKIKDKAKKKRKNK